MSGNARGPRHTEERARGVGPGDPIVLEVNNLGKDFYSREGLFGKRKFEAVKDVSFKLPKGKTLGLVGESGSGKTTVGLTLMRLHEASTGEAIFEGRDLLAMSPREFMAYKRRIQIIFQNPYASLNPRFTIGNILTEPMEIHGIGSGAAQSAPTWPSSSWTRSGCRRPRSTSIRTNSRVASGSGSRSRAASR